MRKAALGMSVALFAGVALTACGNEPEPMAPVDPGFDRTIEPTDTDDQNMMTPDPTLPETGLEGPAGTPPGQIPEVMEQEGTFTPDEPRGDAAGQMMDDPEVPAEDPL